MHSLPTLPPNGATTEVHDLLLPLLLQISSRRRRSSPVLAATEVAEWWPQLAAATEGGVLSFGPVTRETWGCQTAITETTGLPTTVNARLKQLVRVPISSNYTKIPVLHYGINLCRLTTDHETCMIIKQGWDNVVGRQCAHPDIFPNTLIWWRGIHLSYVTKIGYLKPSRESST